MLLNVKFKRLCKEIKLLKITTKVSIIIQHIYKGYMFDSSISKRNTTMMIFKVILVLKIMTELKVLVA